ncbi:MAG: GTP 3',8-cyclase MoaA [Terrimicrobiaceae bacterium]
MSRPILTDRLGRPLRDLRISITDRCNFRCTYCMPREVFGPGYQFLRRDDLLTFEEITRLVGIFTSLGVGKIRITGGEPTLRRGLMDLLVAIRGKAPTTELTLTTNGSRLAGLAHPLATAGLDRVSVSLDALDEPTFQKMNDAFFPAIDVVQGIEAAVAAGFSPVKINAVIRRGINEHAIQSLAERFSGPEHIVRFIEYMDVGNSNHWRMNDVVPAAEMAARLESGGLSLSPLPPNYPGEVAKRYQTASGGEIGIISSVTQPFCKDCHRARLSSDGRLFTCLFASRGTDLRTPLRTGATNEEMMAIISSTWSRRDDRYSEIRSEATQHFPKVEMSQIGG